MQHALLVGAAVLLVIVAMATGLLIGLSRKTRPAHPQDPYVNHYRRLAQETAERRQESQRHLEALRDTLRRGLNG